MPRIACLAILCILCLLCGEVSARGRRGCSNCGTACASPSMTVRYYPGTAKLPEVVFEDDACHCRCNCPDCACSKAKCPASFPGKCTAGKCDRCKAAKGPLRKILGKLRPFKHGDGPIRKALRWRPLKKLFGKCRRCG